MYVKSLIFVLLLAVVSQETTAEHTSYVGRFLDFYANMKRNQANTWNAAGRLFSHKGPDEEVTTFMGRRKEHIAEKAEKFADVADTITNNVKRTAMETGIQFFMGSKKSGTKNDRPSRPVPAARVVPPAKTEVRTEVRVETSRPGSPENPFFPKNEVPVPKFSHPTGPGPVQPQPRPPTPVSSPPVPKTVNPGFFFRDVDGSIRELSPYDVMAAGKDIESRMGSM